MFEVSMNVKKIIIKDIFERYFKYDHITGFWNYKKYIMFEKPDGFEVFDESAVQMKFVYYYRHTTDLLSTILFLHYKDGISIEDIFDCYMCPF